MTREFVGYYKQHPIFATDIPQDRERSLKELKEIMKRWDEVIVKDNPAHECYLVREDAMTLLKAGVITDGIIKHLPINSNVRNVFKEDKGT
jgi:hypothetical protein